MDTAVSRRRRKHRGERPPALLGFDHGQLTAEPDTADNPLTRPCPHCHASPGNPCIRLGRLGGRMTGYHDSRKENP